MPQRPLTRQRRYRSSGNPGSNMVEFASNSRRLLNVVQSNPTCIYIYIYPNSDATSFEKFVSVCYGQSPLLKPCIVITVFSACLYPCYSVSTLSLSSNVCMCSTFAQGYKPFRSLGTLALRHTSCLGSIPIYRIAHAKGQACE